MLPHQVVYRQVRQQPQIAYIANSGPPRRSTAIPTQHQRIYGTPIKNQRSQSYARDSSIQKQMMTLEQENNQLAARVEQLKQHIAQHENDNQNDVQEQYLVACRIYNEMKIEVEQLKLELSYIKQENGLLQRKLKQQNM